MNTRRATGFAVGLKKTQSLGTEGLSSWCPKGRVLVCECRESCRQPIRINRRVVASLTEGCRLREIAAESVPFQKAIERRAINTGETCCARHVPGCSSDEARDVRLFKTRQHLLFRNVVCVA